MNETAKRIRKLRKQTELSQVEFARLFGIPTRTIENWEMDNDKSKPPAYIINLLEISINELIKSNYSKEITDILSKK